MENNTAELSKYRIQQARQCIKSAKTLVHINDYRGAANRSYYAIFHTMRSVLALEIRSNSDYDDFYVISIEEVNEQIENSIRFCDAVESYLKKNYKYI